jgi:hypothetical protein
MGSSRAPHETNVRHRRSWCCHCSCQCRVLRYPTRRGDETLRARDEDDYAADVSAADIAAGRINVGAHDSTDDGDAGNNTTTKCAACNAGRHFVSLDHNNARGGAGHRCSHRWFTAACVGRRHPVVGAPRIGHKEVESTGCALPVFRTNRSRH